MPRMQPHGQDAFWDRLKFSTWPPSEAIVQTQTKQLRELLEMLGFYRGMVLDACEQELGDSQRWEFLRSRLLKIFGNSSARYAGVNCGEENIAG
jgi:hypothetical protein